mgnify:CR=1 FL=1
MFKLFVQTLGCKVNSYESDALTDCFRERGFELTQDYAQADVFLINTCTVTAEADRKSRQMIRRAKKRAPHAVVAAMGCQVEMNVEKCEADVFVGTKDRIKIVDEVVSLLLQRLNSLQSVKASPSIDRKSCDYQEYGSVVAQDSERAFIKIQDGCDRFCSYCIIPYARGRSRSRSFENIISEARMLSASGYKEVVITGINICAYGLDFPRESVSLVDVVRGIADCKGIHRIRLGSMEPMYLSKSVIENFSGIEKLCKHFHISLQSGSDRVLNAMNRHYDTGFFKELVLEIKRLMPEASITTDIIAGFPSETREEHEESLSFAASCSFSKIHVFPYSSRKGTLAEQLTPVVSPEIIKSRTEDFLELARLSHQVYAMSRIGCQENVLVELREKDGLLSGYSEGYLRVYLQSGDDRLLSNVIQVIPEALFLDGVIGKTMSYEVVNS